VVSQLIKKKKILFVAYGGGHVNMLLPVVQTLLAQGRHEVLVLGLTTAAGVLARAGVPHIGFRDLVTADDAAALAHGNRLSEGVNSDLVPREETVAYMGLSYADLEAEHGVEGAAAIYAERGRHAFLPLRTLERLLASYAPDLVVATNSPRAERAALLAARKLGIASLCLLDLYPSADGQWFKDEGYGSKICVLNHNVKAILTGFGRSADSIVVTGNPAFDRHYTFTPTPEVAALRAGQPVVGYASNILPGRPEGDLQLEVFERLRARCARKGYKLAVRQHPNEARWRDIGDAVDCNGMPIEAYLSALDMLVTFPSTIALEAQIHGVRVGLLDFTSLSEACAYLFNGDVDAFKTVEALDDLVVDRRAGERGAAATTSATANVCATIENILEGN
jgi:hypothetical protein